jgi:general secretion pathway protein D
MTRLAALLAALLLVPAARAADDATVALNFQDVELPVLAKFVSEVTGRNFIVDDRVRGKVTIISPTRITADEAYAVFQSVLQVKGFTTVPSGPFVKIVPAAAAREAPGARAGGADEVVTRILPLRHAEAEALVPVVQPLVSKDGLLTAYPATNSLVIVDTGANIDRVAGILAALDAEPSASAVRVLPLRFASADELAPRVRAALGGGEGGALRVVADARTNALLLGGSPAAVRRAEGVVERLDLASPAGATQMHVVRLRYAQADPMLRVLSHLLGLPDVPPAVPEPPRGSSFMRSSARRSAAGLGYDTGLGTPAPLGPPPAAPEPASAGTGAAVPLAAPVRLTADPALNALIVSAAPEDWRTLEGVIRGLDVPRRQVFVEAIILEATIDKTRALGIEFRATPSFGGSEGLAQANFGALAGALGDPTSLAGLLLAAASNQTVRLPNGQEVPAHAVLLTALEQDADVNVLSAPTLVTTDNEEAEIVVGRNVPFVASRATSAANLANLFTTIERHDVGITLRLRPQITGEDFVRLDLFEEVSDIDPTAAPAVGDPTLVGPTTTIRSASTAIAARDGQTVVIGGLLADTVRATERRVPYLGRIPVLGALFRRDDGQRTKTNLLVFLTPHIIGSDAAATATALRERERLRRALPPRLRDQPALTAPSWDGPPAAEAAP